MREFGFPIPKYVETKHASGVEAVADNPSGIRINSQENVWRSAIKLACSDCLPAVHASYQKQITDAARRYGILEDIKSAYALVEKYAAMTMMGGIEFDPSSDLYKDDGGVDWEFESHAEKRITHT